MQGIVRAAAAVPHLHLGNVAANVEAHLEQLPYEYIRWIENPEEVPAESIQGTSDMKRVKDLKDRPLLLFENEWSIGMTLDRNKGLRLAEFSRD